MNKAFGNDDPRLRKYVEAVYQQEDAILLEIRTRAAREGLPEIQVCAGDARHLQVLAAMVGARRAVEIGTLGGYSGVSILRGMSAGVLDTFEIDSHHARVAKESFRLAGFADRVRIHLGPALEKLRSIEPDAPFDFCFIDADKEGYADYLDWAARHLRKGGVVVADNAFLFGELAATPLGDSAAVRSMNAFHRRLATSGEFVGTVLPTGEGLAVGVRI